MISKFKHSGWLKKAIVSLAGLGLLLWAWSGLGLASSLAQSAQEGQAIFQQRCAACHTIGGGRLVGPDLQGVTTRRELSWLQTFIAAPDKQIAAGDPIVLQLLSEYNNVPMPNLGLTPAEVDQVIAYLESASAAPAGATPAAAAPASTTTGLVAGDPARGLNYFNGALALANGGPNCIACHNVSGAGPLGGGTLGPDLTQVATRYGGEAGLGSVLATLPFPTMQSSFATRPLTPQEQADLLAFFVQSAQIPATGTAAVWTKLFLGVGAVGALVLFGIMAVFWPSQRQSISNKLRKQA